MEKKAIAELFQKYSYIKPISAGIYKTVYSSIVKGHLNSGDCITIEELADICHTSRTPAREAVRQLEADGILSFNSTIGYYVHVYSYKECKDLMEVSRILQAAAIKKAAANITDLYLNMLEKTVQESENAVSSVDFFKLNREFHMLIARCADNEYLEEQIKNIYIRIFLFDFAKHPNTDIPRSIREHKEIIEALRRKDADYAEKLYMEHSRNTENLLSWSLHAENSDYSKIL